MELFAFRRAEALVRADSDRVGIFPSRADRLARITCPISSFDLYLVPGSKTVGQTHLLYGFDTHWRSTDTAVDA